MSNRALVVGIVVVLAVGGVGALLMRTGDNGDASDELSYRPEPGDTLPPAPIAPPPDVDDHLPPMLEVGAAAPDFELTRLDGDTFSLQGHRDRIVLLNFWATWCEPCRDEMPDLQQLWEAYRDDGLLVIGISLDEGGRSVVEEFHQTFPVEYPLLLNGSAVAAEYGADRFVPTTFVIGRDGRILERHIGAITREEFEAPLRALL